MNVTNLTPYLWQTEQVNELVQALVNFQIAFENVSLKKDGKGHANIYVTLDNLINTIRPLLSSVGLTVSQDLSGEFLTTVIYHISGQFRGSAMPFSPMSGNKGTNALQELGGGITYAKRYALSALLCISVDTDDDGKSSKITKKEVSKKKVIETDAQWEFVKNTVAKNPAKNLQAALDSFELTPERIAVLKQIAQLDAPEPTEPV